MLMFTIEDGPKFWFIRGKVNKTLQTIVSIHNKNCKFVKEGSSLDKETIDKEDIAGSSSDNIIDINKQVAGIEQNDKKICIETLSEELSLDEYDLAKFDVTIKILKNLEDPKKKLTPFKLLFRKDYRYVLMGVTSMLTADYLLFYSTSFGASTLEFGSTNINTIVFAVPQIMTYIVL